MEVFMRSIQSTNVEGGSISGTFGPPVGRDYQAEAIVGVVGGLGLHDTVVKLDLRQVVGSFWGGQFTPVES